MAKLLSNGIKHQFVPADYVFPPSKRPEIHRVKAFDQVPVIRLDGNDELSLSNQILDAGKEFGCFQVSGHGVSEELLRDMMEVSKEFFDMPVEDKALYYSEDPKKFPRLSTSLGYDKDDTRSWRDCLRLATHNTDVVYPDKPARFREITAKFAQELRRLAARILMLIAKGLGLDDSYFIGELSREARINVNHYPPCPDPSLSLGLLSHCDPNLITFLLQDGIGGLQVLHGGEWFQVDPNPNVFFVNFGHIFEVITNGLIKGVEHRVVTNESAARTSIAVIVMPAGDCTVEPAPCKLPDSSPPLYRSFMYADFFAAYVTTAADRVKTMGPFMLRQ